MAESWSRGRGRGGKTMEQEEDCSGIISTEEEPERKSKVRSGMVAVSDGKSRPRAMRLHLSMEVLRLQTPETDPVDTSTSPPRRSGSELSTPGTVTGQSTNTDLEGRVPPPDARERVVEVRRQRTGGLGLSIKGGAEHKLPILISRIFREQAADQTGQLFVGDAIVRVNGQEMYGCNHDAAVNMLRNAGDTVTLTVKHYRAATPFLQHTLPREDSSRSLMLDNARSSDEWPRRDSVTPGSRRSSSAVGSTGSAGRWVDVVTVPLMMAYVTRYIFGTDKLRPNAFEVRGLNGTSTGIIQCGDAAILSQWLKYITDNIVGLTSLQMKLYNRSLASAERIEYMGWVNEGVLNNNQPWQCWRPRFLTLRSTDVLLSDSPPLSTTSWGDNCLVFRVYQSMFRVIKDSENVDERQHCFLLQTAGQESRYLSVETRQELLRIEAAWHCAVCSAVMKLGSKTFSVVWSGRPAGLTLDWNVGFVLADTESGATTWRYKFSQLKGSSDDNKCRLKLHFQLPESRIIETRELECATLQSLLFCMHAFLTAKVASVDPAFLSSKEP